MDMRCCYILPFVWLCPLLFKDPWVADSVLIDHTAYLVHIWRHRKNREAKSGNGTVRGTWLDADCVVA